MAGICVVRLWESSGPFSSDGHLGGGRITEQQREQELERVMVWTSPQAFCVSSGFSYVSELRFFTRMAG